MKCSMRGRPRLAARIAAVAAVLCASLATAAWSNADHRPASSTPYPTADTLNAVAALSKSDAWVVGTKYLPSDDGVFLTLIEHWNGQSWSAVPSPSPAGMGPGGPASILGAVAVDSPSDAWAVGSRSPGSTNPDKIPPSHGLIEHWNGTTWSVVPGPRSGGHTNALNAVAAISPNAAWAIGDGTVAGHAATVFMRWNGSSWRYLPSPAGAEDLSSMAVVSAHDIWAVGTRTVGSSSFRTLAEHWNGSKWTTVPTPNVFKGRTRKSILAAVGASSGDSIWAVGWYQSGSSTNWSSLVEHWGGSKWRIQHSPNVPGTESDCQLFAIAATSRSDAWAVGGYDSSQGLAPLIERWNGASWTILPSQLQPGVIDATLDGAAAVNSDDAWAVGEALNQQRHPITLVEQWNGSSWQQVPSPNP